MNNFIDEICGFVDESCGECERIVKHLGAEPMGAEPF